MVDGVLTVYITFLILIQCVAGDFRVRLVGGTEWSGRLEVSINDTWGTVCGNGFGSNESQVVCRMLGFNKPRPVSVGSDMFGKGSGAILIDSLICTGTEKSLEECTYGRNTNCSHQYDVGVICNIPGELTVRLGNGMRSFGLLKILYDGVWSTVCSRGFGHKEVKVVCKMIKPQSPHAVAWSLHDHYRGRDEDSILFSDLDCDGTESSLAQCKHSGFYNHTCTHDNDVGVLCELDAEYRLAGTHKTRNDMGRLEILVGPVVRQGVQGVETIVPRVWSGICGNTYSTISTARVICKQFGHSYSGAMLVPGSSFGPSTGFWITDVNCRGDETSMTACVQLITDYSLSCPAQEIGVICSNTSPGLYILFETTRKDAVYPPIEDSNVTFKCEGTKSIPSTAIYTWTEAAGGRPSGAYLIFETLTRAHNGRSVKCEANLYYNDSYERVSSEVIKLQVYYKPLIRIKSDANTCQPHTTSNTCYVNVGHDVTLECSAESSPPPISFEWSEKDMATDEKLYIISANASRHEGLYNCTVQTKSYDYDSRLPLSSSYMFTVIVQEIPVVLGFTANGEDNTTIIVDENSNVSLSCEASGKPTPDMVLLSGANSRELKRLPQSDSQSTKKRANIYFFLQSISCQDSGGYSCQAHNSAGQSSRTLFILAPCAPRVKGLEGRLPPVTIIDFQESFTLELIAYPPPEVKQMYYGPVSDTLGGQRKDRLDVTCGAKTFAPALFTCNITVVNKSDDGVYRIVFENDHGHLPFNFTRGNLDWVSTSSQCRPELMSIPIRASLLAATIFQLPAVAL